MNNWGNLGVVDTIYEDEFEYEYSTTSPSLISSPTTPLHSTVKPWCLENGCETDVKIYVHGTCFNLHKDRLISRSKYLKRQLTELKELTLSPPLNITAEVFSLVADFCYQSYLILTPFNVAALRIAAELLEMTETSCEEDDNLNELTESYLHRVVAVNRESAMIVFNSSISLLPEAETTSFLVTRCVEALYLMDDNEGVDSCLDNIVRLAEKDFEIIVDSMHCRYSCHDVIYRIADLYLKEQNEVIGDQQKIKICNSVDCNKLSPEMVMHAVQNPRMPIRFIIKAMLVEQLHTRHSIFTAATTNHKFNGTDHHQSRACATLGEILKRDAAVRQSAQLKSAMEATSSRIQILEKELTDMKTILSDQGESERTNIVRRESKSASFHYGSERNRIGKGERGSVSSLNFRNVIKPLVSSSSGDSSTDQAVEREIGTTKKIGRRLVDTLKKALRISKPVAEEVQHKKSRTSSLFDSINGVGIEKYKDDVIVIERDDDPFSHEITPFPG